MSQTLWGRVSAIMKWVGGVATIVSLLIGMTSLYGLYDAELDRQETIVELADAADELRDGGDFRRAWALYDQAAAIDESSARVRRGREQLALAWLPAARVSEGETFSALVDRILPVLLRGMQQSSGNKAADFQALVGWAHYLDRRDAPFSQVDVVDAYRAAIDVDPGNVYAHTFWGHWLLSEEQDVAGATSHFQAAVASGRHRTFVRSYHASGLRNLLFKTTSGTPEAFRAQGALLALMHDMVAGGESLVGTFDDGKRTLYETLRAYDVEHFDQIRGALHPAEHRALAGALVAAADEPDSYAVQQMGVFLARLDEAEGDAASALARYMALGERVESGSRLRPAVDGGLERLTGEKTRQALERENPVAFFSRRLQDSAPGEPVFERALAYFSRVADDGVDGRDAAAIPDSIDALRAGRQRLHVLVSGQPEDDPDAADLSATREAYWSVTIDLGRLLLATRSLDGAIATLGGLDDIPPARWMNGVRQYNLACAYALRSQTQLPGAARDADADAAVARLEAAVGLGMTDWDHIKRDKDLDGVRQHTVYKRLMAGR